MPPSDGGGLVSEDVRRHNLALVVEHIVRFGASARSEIATATGLTRGAVTALTAALTDARVLSEGEPIAGGRGRPLTRLELAADGVAVIALQLDAENATVLVTDLSGAELFRAARPHGRPMGRPSPVLDVLAAVLRSGLEAAARQRRRIADLTVIVFAPVAEDPPVLLADTDLRWGRVDVVGELRSRIPGLPAAIKLTSDSPVAGAAEIAATGGVADAVYVKSNSGIGGAVFSGGREVVGVHGLGGAVGHFPLVPDGERCECGQIGCLVTVAGPDALLHAAGLGDALAHDGLRAALAEFVRRIEAGEDRAVRAWDAALPWIGRALQVLSMITDPDLIIVGGFWAALTPSIAEAFGANRPRPIRAGSPADTRIVAGILGADVALLGALGAARARLLADPLRLAV